MPKKITRTERLAIELVKRLRSGIYSDGRLPSQRRLAEYFGVSRNTVVNALARLEADGWIATSERRRAALTPPDFAFARRLSAFLSGSDFRPPLMNDAFGRQDSQTGDPTESIDLARLCHEHWDDHIQFDMENAAVQRAMARIRRGESDIYRTTGVEQLKTAICRYLKRFEIAAGPHQIAIISRRLQAYRAVSEILLGPKIEMWAPELSLVRFYGVAERHAAKRRYLEMDVDGRINFDAMLFSKRPKVVFLEPTRQKPTGSSLSIEERRQLVDEARRSRTFIFEDAYCELLYENHLPFMASFDPKLESVIHLGAIPTWLTPIGGFSFILAHERIIELLRASARRDYLNPEFLTQLTALELLESDGLDEMLRRFHAFHRRRLRFVAEILARDTGEYACPVLPGSFGCVWLHFDAADIGALYRARRGIDFQPGWFYGESARSCRHVLIRYTMPEAVFDEGMARFGALCRSELG